MAVFAGLGISENKWYLQDRGKEKVGKGPAGRSSTVEEGGCCLCDAHCEVRPVAAVAKAGRGSLCREEVKHRQINLQSE